MALLEKSIQARVNALVNEGNELYNKGEFDKIIELLLMAWDELPEPKEIYDDSYHIARYIIKISLQKRDFTLAKKWAEIIQNCDPERPEIGEKEFIAGQVAFEAGELERAKYLFEIANKKSNQLCFRGQDKKYRQLIK